MPKEVLEESESRASRTRSGARHTKEPGVRVNQPEKTSLGRVGLIISGFIFAGMVLFTLSGYERISRAYADINALNNEIKLTDLRINELEVQIECAVTIQDAQKIAEAYGMQYPEKDQYVRIGDRLPFDNSLPSPAGYVETTPIPETTPVPTTTEPGTTGGGEQPPAGG
ncbi:MAG: hypothetical protein C0413_02970 [Clostridiales bacterium]|nr:hypothetical protein [Clostridiales bacterium]